MSVYSFLHYVTDKVQLNEALASTRRHWSTIWKKRLLACLYIHFYIMSRTKFSWTRLWHQQGDIGRQFERKDFWHVCIFIFTLCHGQSSVERGFNINKETLVDNLKEKSSGMSVYSLLYYVTGKVQLNRGFNINMETLVDILKEKTSGMSVYSFLHDVTGKVQLNEALTLTRRHWSIIWKKRLLACLYIHFYIMSLDKIKLNEALTSTRRHWSTIWKKGLLACLYIHFYIMSRTKFSWTRL